MVFFSESEEVECTIELFEKGPLGEKVAEIATCSGALKFDNPKPWWPYLMTDEEPGNYFFNILIEFLKCGPSLLRCFYILN